MLGSLSLSVNLSLVHLIVLPCFPLNSLEITYELDKFYIKNIFSMSRSFNDHYHFYCFNAFR